MSANNDLLRLEDLVNNPTARVPICLCLDTSGSMGSGSGLFGSREIPIDELNSGVQLFYEAIRADDTARFAAEIMVVTFGDEARLERDFSGVDLQPETPRFSASGNTPMGEAVNLALDRLERRKQEYKAKGVDYYQPWLVLMTDGEPNGSEQELDRAVQRTVDLVRNRKLTIFPIGIGRNADMDVLARFSPNRSPLRLKGLNFKEFFEWLSQSVSRTSQSSPSDVVKLDLDGIKGWAEL